MRFIYSLVFLSTAVSAIQLPFKIPNLPFLQPQKLANGLLLDTKPAGPPRVAIIGAGAGGSSAAFWIAKAKERYGIEVDVDVYDKASYIGGRSTTVYPYNDTSLPPLELGASIFVKPNKNLWRATEEFNLSRAGFSDPDDETGIWDGEKVLLVMYGGSFWREWFSTVKVLWRYGWNAPVQARSLVNAFVKDILAVYTPHTPKWDTVGNLSSAFGWESAAAQTTAEFFDTHGITLGFTRELVEAATRVNYGQNVDRIHALEGMASLAANGAAGVVGGNFQIFEQFLNRSGATVYLDTEVYSISRAKSGLWTLTSDVGTKYYKAVILAAPFHTSGIALADSIASLVPEQPYVHLHVTLLTTTAERPSAEYFHTDRAPSSLLTTWEGVRQGGKAPEFNSLTYHGLVKNATEDSPAEWMVKIFSEERISDEWLNTIFSDSVGWVYRKEWDAYPKLPPTVDYPPLKLDEGFYYVNSFEPLISTMETETVSSRNIVDLLLHEHFDSGICGPWPLAEDEIQEEPKQRKYKIFEEDDTFVLGFDC